MRRRWVGVMSLTPSTPDVSSDEARPWRKRHPVLSRSILYTLGLGLVALLVFLLANRQDEDRAEELAAIQKRIDGLSLVLAADPTGAELLKILDAEFASDDLPRHARQRVLRWRAMAWGSRAQLATTDAARTEAWGHADEAHAACAALDLPPEEAYGLALERTEALLLRRDQQGARAALPALEKATQVPAALLRQFLLAQWLRLEDRIPDACDLLRGTLRGLEGNIAGAPQAYIGGREWSIAQVATEMATFVTTQGGKVADAALWSQLRSLASDDFEVQKAAAVGLSALGADDDALAAWRAAVRLDGRLAGIEAARDEVLGRLDSRLRRL